MSSVVSEMLNKTTAAITLDAVGAVPKKAIAMFGFEIARRRFLTGIASTAAAVCAASQWPADSRCADTAETVSPGHQRLPLDALRRWESLRYGMFLYFGMSTFVRGELPDGRSPAIAYAPDRLDVDQWVSVARDAGISKTGS